MLERFDHQFKIFGSPDQRTLPSELFARQCVISFDPDEVALAFTAEQLGADKILWASDYPHPDAKIPGVVKELAGSGRAAARGVAAARDGCDRSPFLRPLRAQLTRDELDGVVPRLLVRFLVVQHRSVRVEGVSGTRVHEHGGIDVPLIEA